MVGHIDQSSGAKRTADGSGLWQPHGLRVKRAMLGGRRMGAPSTPVPRWKLYENPFYDGIAAAAAAAAQQQNANGGGRHIAVSARKLAATLWELQEIPIALGSSKSASCPCAQYRGPTPVKKPRNHFIALTDLKSPSPSRSSSHPSPSPNSTLGFPKDASSLALQPSKAWDQKRSSQSSRQVAAMRSHVHRLLERRGDPRVTQIVSASSNISSLTVEAEKHAMVPSNPSLDRRAKIMASGCVTTSNELLKVLDRIRSLEEQHTSSTSMVSTLRAELDHSRARVHDIELAHKSARREIDNLLKKFQEERAIWRSKEQDKIRAAVQSVKLEVEEERKLRRRMETVNRRMSRELIEANMAATKAIQELERERKARELMEDVCDELAREIGDDKAEFEELKRESARIREEVEEERKMLQMAEVWREERVQMKLAEARLELEEKCSAFDNLRADLEAFLKAKLALRDGNDAETSRTELKEAEELRNAMNSLQLQNELRTTCQSPETDEAASDLYSVELNTEPRDHRGGAWGYSASTAANESRNRTSGWEKEGDSENDWRLESRAQVLERLRRKWEENGLLSREAEVQDASRHWEGYGNDSEEIEGGGGGGGGVWNSQCELQGEDAKEEDGSQWESASEQDMEAAQTTIVFPSPQTLIEAGRGDDSRAEHDDDAGQSAGVENADSPETMVTRPGLHTEDDSWKVSTSGSRDTMAHKASQEEQQMSAKGSRDSASRGVGVGESSRVFSGQGAHIRLAAEQGIASPSRDWRSPDRGNPHIARAIKGFIEWPKMSRENGHKGKFVEAKLEKGERRFLRQST